MIELAPNHKIGLSVANPILLASGSIGYGEAIHPGLATAKLGAAVVGPVLMHSRAGTPPPRLRQIEGGFVLDTGLQNRGLDATLRNFARFWPRLGCPVIVQVAESNPRYLSRIVQRLEVTGDVAGIELLLDPDIEGRSAKNLVRAVIESCDLPLWVKLPLARAAELAAICVQAEAAGIVLGSAFHSLISDSPFPGNLFGPVVFPHVLRATQQIVDLHLACALIACGGIYTSEQVQQLLAAGAQAVQIDSAVWVEPGLPENLRKSLMAVR